MNTLLTDPLWWHWMAFGFLLIGAEIIVPSFVVIWFGISAVIVSIFMLLFDISFAAQLFWWIFFSVVLLYIWFKKYKPKNVVPKVGQADEDLGKEGVIIQKVPAHGRGRARFEVPVLGSSEWVVTADEEIEKGAKVITVETLGNMLKVKKI